MEKQLLIIAGPTGVGKTKLAMDLYDSLNAELISADSMQIYKKCDIATAKPSKELLKKYPHHNIDILDTTEEYSVAMFKNNTEEILSKVYAENKLPIIVGGTGLYIESLIFPYNFANCNKDEAYRNQLNTIYKEKGIDALYLMLLEKDENTARVIEKNNVKKIIRALEICEKSENKISQIKEKKNFEKSIYNYFIVFLTKDRETLYNDINQRVDEMIANGLVDEAKFVYELQKTSAKPLQVSSAIGYKELFEYFEKVISLDEAIEKVKQHTRNYAKRQITWYKRYTQNIVWLNNKTSQDYEQIKNCILDKYSAYKKENTQ